jgi:phage tail sheath gpL-like
LASGATADSNVAALATIASSKYYYIVSAAGDATQLGALATQVNNLAAPTVGLRQRAIGGAIGTLGATTTIATGINKARTEIVWQEKALLPEAELAANQAAIITLFETKPNPRTNYANFGQDAVTSDFWVVPAQRLKSAWPSRTSIKSALNNGISPIGVQTNGGSYLVNRITSRSLNGATNDYRIRAAHKVTICDFFGDDLLAKTVLQFSGRRIMDDPAKGQRPPGGSVVTPTIYKGAILGLLDVYDTNDLLDNIAAIKAGLVVQRETSPTTRMSARIPMRCVDNAEAFAIALDQVS